MTDLKGKYHQCVAIFTCRFFSLKLSEVRRYVSRFVLIQRLVVVARFKGRALK